MSKYTIELRKVCDIYTRKEVENWFKNYELSDYLLPDQEQLLKNSNIWNKDKLAKKIVDHYYMREIGFETPALFKHYAKITMEEIMEEKLPILYTTAIKYDPLINVDFTETYERDTNGSENNKINGNSSNQGSSQTLNNGSSNSSSNSNSSGISVNSDTPQGQINKNEILKGKYASNVTANETNSQVTDNTQTNNTIDQQQNSSSTTNETFDGLSTNKEKSTRHQIGNSGALTTSQNLIKQFRDIIVAVDKDIIQDLNILFMNIY